MAGRGSRLGNGKGAKAAGPVWALASLEAWSSRRQLMARGGAGCLPLHPTASLRCDEQDTGRCRDFPEGAELLHLPAVSAAEGPSCGCRGQGKDGESLGWKGAECQCVAVEPGGFCASVAWLELRGCREGPRGGGRGPFTPQACILAQRALRFHVIGRAPEWGEQVDPPTAPSRRWALSLLNKKEVGNFPQ